MDEIFHILTDFPHWVAEGVMDATFAVPAYLLGRWRLRVHDRRRHGLEG